MDKRNYVKYYEDYYGIKIPDGFVVHHINRNRENNNIDNLIMLPNILHAKYHSYINLLSTDNILLDMHSLQKTDVIKNLAKTIEECREWIVKKYDSDISKFMENK